MAAPLLGAAALLVCTGRSLATQCVEEPWGRYSASGVLWNGHIFIAGGDTRSDGDGRGGLVETNWDYSIEGGCWSRMPDSHTTNLGYRGTAVVSEAGIALIFGGTLGFTTPVNHMFRWELGTGAFTQVQETAPWPAERWRHAAVMTPHGMLVTGGRAFGSDVRGDAWLWTGTEWRDLGECVPGGIYRHSMAWYRGEALLFGGLDGTLSRHNRMYRLTTDGTNASCSEVLRASADAPWPARRASHGMAVVADALYMWGGTCSDTAVWRWDSAEGWCSVPQGDTDPSRRDAFVWGEDHEGIWMATGDVICLGGIYGVADVWYFNATTGRWILHYAPYNSRSDVQDVCTGAKSQPTGCRTPESEASIPPRAVDMAELCVGNDSVGPHSTTADSKVSSSASASPRGLLAGIGLRLALMLAIARA